ncbi:MAG TPA: right-handed parallel beta-helix repeat-containing protein [archaeon]|nr:right-handed parallel beta-helix repeat-containing protein [archaeon]
MRLTFIIAVLLALPLFAGQVDAATTNVSTCSNLNTAGEVYTLNTSITGSSSNSCINIGANNIIFDCWGFTLDGDGTLERDGINATGRTNITIRNCTTTDWARHIVFHNVNNSLITNHNGTSVFGGQQGDDNNMGIIVMGVSHNNTLSNVTAQTLNYSNFAAMNISKSNFTRIINTTIATSRIAIQFTGANYTSISNSSFKHLTQGFNTNGPFLFGRIFNNTFVNVTFVISESSGLGSHNLFTNNTILNSSSGMFGSANNTYTYNYFKFSVPQTANGLLYHSGGSGGPHYVMFNTFNATSGTHGVRIAAGAANITLNTFINVSIAINLAQAATNGNVSFNTMINGTGRGLGIYNARGLDLYGDLNRVFNNTFMNIAQGITVDAEGSNNTIENNTILNVTNGIVLGQDPGSPFQGPQNTTIAYNNIGNVSLGIWFFAREGNVYVTTLNTIKNNTISFSNIGTDFDATHNNTIINNTYASNNIAIKLTSSQNNTIQNNTFIDNGQGVVFDPSPNNILASNLFRRNKIDVIDDSANTYTNNIFHLPDNSTFLRNSFGSAGSIDTRQDFNLSVILPNGSTTGYTINSIAIYPTVPFLYENRSEGISGNFSTSQGGVSSLVMNITATGGNSLFVQFPFFIGGNIQEQTTYFLKSLEPLNGQPRGYDANNSVYGVSMRTGAPDTEFVATTATAQIFSLDENPLKVSGVQITEIRSSLIYRASGIAKLGFQSVVSHGNDTLFNTTLPSVSNYTQNTTTFLVNWTLDSPEKWLTIGGKVVGASSSWKTNETDTSNVTFVYKYAASAPQIFNITEGATVVSAGSNSTNYVVIAVESESPANLTIRMPSSSTYTIYYDNATCSSPTCNATQVSNNITLGLALGSVHMVEFVIPTSATTTTTVASSGGSAATQGNVVTSSGTPTVDEQAATTSVPASSVPARPGEYTISEDGAVILLEGNLTAGNETTPGTIYIVGYPQSPFIVGGIVKSDPLKYGSLPQRAGYTTKAFTSYNIKIESGVAYFCMNYRGFENPSSVSVYEYANGTWQALGSDRFANNATTSTACGTVRHTPYMVAGFVAGTAPVTLPVTLPTAVTSVPLVVYILGALAAVAYFAYRFRSRKK